MILDADVAPEPEPVPNTEAATDAATEADDAPDGAHAFEDLAMTVEEEVGLGKQCRDPLGEDGMQESDVPGYIFRIYQAELSDPEPRPHGGLQCGG